MTQPLSPIGGLLLTAGSVAVTFANPARADTLALLGDLTSGSTTRYLQTRLRTSAGGRQMLRTLTPPRFPLHGSSSLPHLHSLPAGSLGLAYAQFMHARCFTAESRHAVRFVDDVQQRWIVQRYRDVHDIWDVLTGLPTTLLGETAQKPFELTQTRLPVAALSVVAETLRVDAQRRRVLLTQLAPWAVRSGSATTDLLAIRYEDYLHRDLNELRRLWRIEAAPRVKGAP